MKIQKKYYQILILTLLLTGWHQVGAQEQQLITGDVAGNTIEEKQATVTVQQEDPGGAIVSMSFDETPLSDVIKAFREATGANIISGSSSNLNATVSVSLDNVSWYKGLSSILDQQGLQLVEQPPHSGIYLVADRAVEVVPRFTKVFSLEYSKADDISDLFTTMFGRKGSTVTPFNSANAVIIHATEQEIAECENIIKTVDKPSPQVYIEVRFAELSAGASKKLGLKWDALDEWGVNLTDVRAGMEYNKGRMASYKTGRSIETASDGTTTITEHYVRPNTIPAASITSAGLNPGAGRSAENMHWRNARGIGGQLSADDFRVVLSAFEQMDGVSIFSNPRIIVANEKEAVVDISTKEPNLSVRSSRTGTAGDQLDVSARLELIPGNKGDKDGKGKGLFAGEAFFYYGVNLKVTPRISSSGLITVNIEPSISNLQGYYGFDIPPNSTTIAPKFPVIYMQRLQTVFSMMDGTTAVIGGLSKTTEESTDSGIPGLRSIPWVGSRIFGWKSRQKIQKEIIIFVTVGIADPMNLSSHVGMPKNAVLGKELLDGTLKEPGDRTKAEILSLEPINQPDKKESVKSIEVEVETLEEVRVNPVVPATPMVAPTKPLAEAEAPMTPLLQN